MSKHDLAKAEDALLHTFTLFSGVVEMANLDAGEGSGQFSKILKFGLERIGLVASELASDLDISKAAISKWVNGKAVPNSPTRKAVMDWVGRKTLEEIKKMKEGPTAAFVGTVRPAQSKSVTSN